MNPLLEKYIDNSLSAAEQVELDLLLISDSNLKIEFDKYKAARMLSEAILEDEIIGNIEKLQNPVPETSHHTKYILLVLAAVIVGFLMYIFSKSSHSKTEPSNIQPDKTLFAQVYKEPVWPVERGDSDKLQGIISDYLSGRTKDAISQLESEIAMYPDSLTLQYWMAEIYTKESLPAKTEKYLSKIIVKNYTSDRLPYLEIITLIQSGQEAKALAKIDLIYKTSHPEYQEIYDQIKDKLKKG